MNYLWNCIDSKDWRAGSKYKAFIFTLAVIFTIAGALLWCVVRNVALKSLDWMFCFSAYAFSLSLFASFYYILNRNFHDGAPRA
ncbi:MAG: hypothetical protein Q4E57_03870 [Eubacteriales bacterium]|nr:hypothetical protein [Eubacteriales bacterium]